MICINVLLCNGIIWNYVRLGDTVSALMTGITYGYHAIQQNSLVHVQAEFKVKYICIIIVNLELSYNNNGWCFFFIFHDFSKEKRNALTISDLYTAKNMFF